MKTIMKVLNDLLDCIDSKSIVEKREAWIEEMLTTSKIASYDSENAIVETIDVDEEHETSFRIYTYEDYWVDCLKLIIKKAKEAIITLKYLRGFESHQFNETLELIIKDLERNIYEIKALPFQLTKGITQLEDFVDSLRKEYIRLQGKVSQKGLSITYTKANNEKFLNELFDWLVQLGKLSEEDQDAFISLFTSKWNGPKLTWYGTPAEFIGFRYSLFNPIKGMEDSVSLIDLQINSNILFLQYFTILSHPGITPEELRKIRPNPSKDTFYRKITNKIIHLLSDD